VPEPVPAPKIDHHDSQSEPVLAVETAEKKLGEKKPAGENRAPVKLEASPDPGHQPASSEQLAVRAPITPHPIAPRPSVPEPIVPAIVPVPKVDRHQSQSESIVALEPDEKSVGEKSPAGENRALVKNALVKNPSTVKSTSSDFSPTHFSPTKKIEFSPTKKIEFSPTKETEFLPTKQPEFSPTKKRSLKLVKPIEKKGRRGRPRNPDLPPTPGLYWYWQKARNGLKLEKRRPEYEYIGFIMPEEWVHLRGYYDESYLLKIIQSAIRVKRARTAQNSRTGDAVDRKQIRSGQGRKAGE
jgi:hypothetical protein